MGLIKEMNREYLSLMDKRDIYDYRNEMLKANPIDEIVKAEKRTIDGQSEIYFDVTGMQSLAEIYNNKDMQRTDVMNLFAAVLCIANKLEEILIEEKHISLNPEHIFYEIKSGKYYFICIPSESNEKNENIKHILLFIMQHMDNTDTQLADGIYGLYGYTESGSMNYETMYRFVYDRLNENTNEVDTEEIKAEVMEPVENKHDRANRYNFYIPSFKECVALLMTISGMTLIGYDIYLRMVATLIEK